MAPGPAQRAVRAILRETEGREAALGNFLVGPRALSSRDQCTLYVGTIYATVTGGPKVAESIHPAASGKVARRWGIYPLSGLSHFTRCSYQCGGLRDSSHRRTGEGSISKSVVRLARGKVEEMRSGPGKAKGGPFQSGLPGQGDSHMNCPACGTRLKHVVIGSITADVCDGGCGGAWFGRFQLRNIDALRHAADELLPVVAKRPGSPADEGRKQKCPQCTGITLMRHFFSVKKEFRVSECPKCGGVWIGAPELAAVRDQYGSQTDRAQAADQLFEKVFGGGLARMRAEGERKNERATKIFRLFRFICPSFYLPGRRKRGAFGPHS